MRDAVLGNVLTGGENGERVQGCQISDKTLRKTSFSFFSITSSLLLSSLLLLFLLQPRLQVAQKQTGKRNKKTVISLSLSSCSPSTHLAVSSLRDTVSSTAEGKRGREVESNLRLVGFCKKTGNKKMTKCFFLETEAFLHCCLVLLFLNLAFLSSATFLISFLILTHLSDVV